MRFPGRARAIVLADCLLILGLAAALVWPVFQLEYLDSWGSIESTFISDARYLKENWPGGKWQPLWYCGTRSDYIYPPALRYGTAFLSRILDVSTARAYHVYIGIFYSIGILAVYALVRAGSGSRGSAWMAAAGAALVSPCFLFIQEIYGDVSGARLIPHRLNVLIRYGEGPHMSAMAVLPLALAAAWFGLRKGRPGFLALAAAASALVVSNNFYGATALVIFFPLVAWSLWITGRDHFVWVRAAAVAALACGLTAFWLTPSYMAVTMRNMKWVSQPGSGWSAWLAAAVLAVFALVTWRLARDRPERAWGVFLAGAVTLITLNVLGQEYFNFRVMGEPGRMAPEFDLAITLAAAECLRRLWNWRPARGPEWWPRAAVVVLALAAIFPSRRYVRHAWEFFPPDLRPENRIEARITGWMARNMPGARALATGSVRFWYDAWHNLAQIGGGSEQGLLNESGVVAYFQITNGDDPELSVLWMQALGGDAIIVHDKKSEELYHDYVKPEKFTGVLEAAYQDGQGNYIYKVPRRHTGLARVVEAGRMRALEPVGFDTDREHLRAYVDAAERSSTTEARWRRQGPDLMRVQATLKEGEAILIQESFDPAWRAWSRGARLAIAPDVLGFMLIEAPPGEHDIRVVFELPLENFLGRIVFWTSVVALAALGAGLPRWGPALWAKPLVRTAAAGGLLFGVNATLNAVLFLPGEFPYRDSIEAGYASTARFISSHPNPWGWNPTQYLGLPTQFTYLPVLHYFAAIWMRLLPWLDPEHVYRIVTVTLACLVPVSVFVCVLYFTRSRWWALATGLAYSLFSPAYYFFWQIDSDRGFALLPWRIQVLVKYGEGPHNAGLVLLPLAIVAVWRAATGKGYSRILLAAVLMAGVTLINWVAAMALAWCCLMALITGIGTRRDTGFRVWPVLAAAGLGYLLACFWLTPSFIQTTAFNWPRDAWGYKLGAQQILLLAGLFAGPVLLRPVFWRLPRNGYLCFLVLAFYGFAYLVTIYYWYKRDTIPESRRYALEAELFLIVLLFELFRQAIKTHRVWLKGAAIGLFLFILREGADQAKRYALQPYDRLIPVPKEHTIEHQVASFLAARKPAGRVYVSGGTRYRLNSWFEIPQLSGTFESGLTNLMSLYVDYQVRTGVASAPGQRGDDAVRLLKAAGVEYVAIHGPGSKEHYRDFKFPREFDGLLERVYFNGDDTVYRVPFHSYAALVRREELPAIIPIGSGMKHSRRYVQALDGADRPVLTARWRGTSGLEVEGRIPEGMLVSVQVSHDKGWEAWQDGRRIPIEMDVMGYMVLHARPAPATRIVLRFAASRETRWLGALSACSWIAALAGLWLEKRRRRAAGA